MKNRKLVVLFGLPACGKSYIGNLMSEKLGFHFYDADNDLPEEMLRKVHNNELFSEEERDGYFDMVFKNIEDLLKEKEKVVVTQVFLREKYRLLLKQKFPEAIMIQVVAPTALTEKRALKRKHMVSAQYAKQVSEHYEEPKLEHSVLENDGTDEELLEKLSDILG